MPVSFRTGRRRQFPKSRRDVCLLAKARFERMISAPRSFRSPFLERRHASCAILSETSPAGQVRRN
jgi:hypothetical protein